MARLTWQNVAAPDFSTALQGYAMQGSLLKSGMNDIASLMGNIGERKKEEASIGAMNAAMRVRDVGGWDQMMQNGGLESLGIAPNQVTPELMDFMRGQREQLSGNRADDLTFQRNTTAAANDVVGLERNRLAQQQDGLDMRRSEQIYNIAEYGQNRTEMADARADENLALEDERKAALLQAMEMADDIALDPEIRSQEEAERKIRLDPNISQANKTIMLEAIGALGDTFGTVDPEFAGAAETQDEFRFAREQLESETSAQMLEYNKNPTLRTYIESSQAYDGAESAGKVLAERLFQDLVDSEGKPLLKDSPGAVVQMVSDYTAEFGLPESMVAQVIDENVRQARRFGVLTGIAGGDQMAVDKGAVRSALKTLSEDAPLLQAQKAEIDAFRTQRDQNSQKIDRLAGELEREMTLTGEGTRTLQRLDSLASEMFGKGQPSPSVPAPAEASQMPFIPANAPLSLPDQRPAPTGPGNGLSFDGILGAAANGRPDPAITGNTPAAPAPVENPEAALMNEIMGFNQTPVQPQANSQAQTALAQAANAELGVSAAVTLIDNTDTSAQAKSQFKQALTALQSNKNSNGEKLSKEDRRRYVARVSKTMSRIAEGEGDTGSVENVDALLRQVREWLPF